MFSQNGHRKARLFFLSRHYFCGIYFSSILVLHCIFLGVTVITRSQGPLAQAWCISVQGLSALLECSAITAVPFKVHCPPFMSVEMWVLLHAAVGYSWFCLHTPMNLFSPIVFVSIDSLLEGIATTESPFLLDFSSEESQ